MLTTLPNVLYQQLLFFYQDSLSPPRASTSPGLLISASSSSSPKASSSPPSISLPNLPSAQRRCDSEEGGGERRRGSGGDERGGREGVEGRGISGGRERGEELIGSGDKAERTPGKKSDIVNSSNEPTGSEERQLLEDRIYNVNEGHERDSARRIRGSPAFLVHAEQQEQQEQQRHQKQQKQPLRQQQPDQQKQQQMSQQKPRHEQRGESGAQKNEVVGEGGINEPAVSPTPGIRDLSAVKAPLDERGSNYICIPNSIGKHQMNDISAIEVGNCQRRFPVLYSSVYGRNVFK